MISQNSLHRTIQPDLEFIECGDSLPLSNDEVLDHVNEGRASPELDSKLNIRRPSVGKP